MMCPVLTMNEKLDAIVQRALADEAPTLYALGQAWGPKPATDRYFGFRPNRGIHDIHMNQVNSGRFQNDNGVWQDGGLIFHFPNQSQGIAIFLEFQSQAWHTDDRTGNALPNPWLQPGVDMEPVFPRLEVPPTDGLVRIVGALINSSHSPEREAITLLNTSNHDIDLSAWHLADKQKNKMQLSGYLSVGQTLLIGVKPPMVLSNKGGIISLLDDRGRKVHGLSYTKSQAQLVDWTLHFYCQKG